jgi:hypothetical protein
MMTEFQNLFGTLTATFVVDAFAVTVLVLSLAAVWYCRPRSQKRADHKVGELARNGEH